MKKQQQKKAKPAMVLGVAWYREADWARIKALFPDADELHGTHAEWLKSAKESVERLNRPDVIVEPFIIDIDDFLGWCTFHSLPRDAKARSEYGGAKLSHEYPSQ